MAVKKLRTRDWVQVIGKEKLKELREAAISTKLKRPLWVRSRLSDAQIAEVYYRIFEKGQSLEKIAKIAKYDWGIHPEWKTQQFVRGLEKWVSRLSTPVKEAKDAVVDENGKRALKYQREKLANLSRRVDALGRLGWAIEQQTERVELFRKMESKYPVEAVDVCLQTLVDMCAKYVDVAVKIGVLEGAPSEVNVNIKGHADVVLKHYVQNDGKKMIECGNILLKRLEEECISMERDASTGKYVEVKERRAVAEFTPEERELLAE